MTAFHIPLSLSLSLSLIPHWERKEPPIQEAEVVVVVVFVAEKEEIKRRLPIDTGRPVNRRLGDSVDHL